VSIRRLPVYCGLAEQNRVWKSGSDLSLIVTTSRESIRVEWSSCDLTGLAVSLPAKHTCDLLSDSCITPSERIRVQW